MPGRRLAAFALVVVAVLVLHIGVGSSANLSPVTVLRELFAGPGGDGNNLIVWQLRLPRAMACVLVGAMLGLAGSSFQALFRNPLADPFIVGVSSGAAVGGSLALVLGLDALLGSLARPMLGFVSGVLALMLVIALARRHGVVDVQSLLLPGAVTGSLLAAVQSLVLLMAGQDTNHVLRWLMGAMHPMLWPLVGLMAVTLVLCGPILAIEARRLNALAIGDDAARRLGVDVRRLRNIVLGTGTVMVAVCVGSVGIIGFLGLAAPHIARRVLGVDWRASMLGSLFVGAALLLVADGLAQRLPPGGELPVGVMTAVLGAPFLLTLLKRQG